jgi:hypothetical protein
MSASVLLVALLAAGPPVEVEGTSRCPEPAAVAAILPEMLPATNDAHPDIAWIETAGLDVSITLRGPDGSTRFARTITSHGSCADLASAAAVIIAAWTTEQNPELSLEQPGVYPSPAKPASRPKPAPPAAEAPRPAPPPAPVRRPFVLEVGAGIGAALDGKGWAGSARVDVGARVQRFGLRLAFAGDSARDESIEHGTATWRKLMVGIGPSIGLIDRTVQLELYAQLALGITMVRGRGYDTNLSATDVSTGLTGALRLEIGRSWVRPWLEIGGRLWFAPQEVAVTKQDQPASHIDLPRTDARVMAGLAFLLRR